MRQKYSHAVEVRELPSAPKAERYNQTSAAQNIILSILFVAMLVSLLYIVWGMVDLTLIKGSNYAVKAETNATDTEYDFAGRGLIVDHNGEALVQNIKTFDLYFVPATISTEKIEELYPSLKDDIDVFLKHHTDKTFTSSAIPTLLIHKLPKEIAIDIQAKNIEGLSIKDGAVRSYPLQDAFSHLLGYTGVASDDDLARDSTIVYNEIVGKNGLEYQYDAELRGKYGIKFREKNALGEYTSDYIYVQQPENGSKVTLSIDKKYQQVLYDKIKKYVDQYNAKGGSGVIINVNTGAVRAIVSYPSYDNNLFVGGISAKEYQKLVDNPRTPLLFRPIGAQEPPGSTFKTLVASAALQENAITKNTVINAPGVIYLSGGTPFQDYRKRVHGNLTVESALMVSSNIFFCRTMIKLGIDKFIPYAEKFGIGQQSGIDLPGEAPGRVPSPQNKIWLAEHGATWLDAIWYPEGDSCNSAIGQGIDLATPLQMANVASTIANNGKVYKPYVVEEITKANGDVKKTDPTVLNRDFISSENLQTVREGMRLGVVGPQAIIGTLKNTPVTVAAKTGTAEFGIKDKYGYLTAHAWVIGFYPYENPEYAFAILLEGGGDSSRAANVMREFLQEVYKK